MRPRLPARRGGTRHRARQRGSVTVELVLAFPLLLLLLLALVQFALWAHAGQVADAAASHALDAARVQGGTAAAGYADAAAVLSQLGTGVLLGPRVHVTRGAATATITITGHAVSVLPVPGLSFPVRAAVTGPDEHFTTAAAALSGPAATWREERRCPCPSSRFSSSA